MSGNIAIDAVLAFTAAWFAWRFAVALKRRGWMQRKAEKVRPSLRSYSSAVVGLRYPAPDGANRSSYAKRLRPGDLIQLVRDPDNEYGDGSTVACFHGGMHLGFIPSRHDWVAESLDEGDELQAVITDFDREGSRIVAIRLDVGVLRDGSS